MKNQKEKMKDSTQSDVNKILKMKDDYTKQKIADMFNISTRHVFNILSGKAWAEVDPKELESFM